MKNLLLATIVANALIFGVQPTALADQADLDAELSNYVAVINGDDFEAEKATMETLRWSGISDAKVYGLIADKLAGIKENKEQRKKAAWYAKALGFSGDDQYRPLLESILSGNSPKNVKKYASIGLKHLANHKSWNAIISQGTAAAPSGKLDETRVANMLRADNYELMRLGAKRIANANKGNEMLIDIAAARLEKEWPSVNEETPAQLDGVAWLLRAIGTSRSGAHKPLLEKVAAGTDNKKIKKYVKKALKEMNG